MKKTLTLLVIACISSSVIAHDEHKKPNPKKQEESKGRSGSETGNSCHRHNETGIYHCHWQ
ncbi:hypothetical protein N9R79_07195 [Vibrio sp.]|nr:hypothetical protein [Vibrio sp.]